MNTQQNQGDEAQDSAAMAARRKVVHEAIEAWKRQLIDLGGRNPLLYYRDMNRGTLDLTDVTEQPEANQLLEGKAVRLSSLFQDAAQRAEAVLRARTIRAKAVENDEERGIQTLHLAYGLATWTTQRSPIQPNAPVVLYRAELRPTGATSDDFIIEVTPEPELNPTLLYLMEQDFNTRVDVDSLLDAVEREDETQMSGEIARLLGLELSKVPGFLISPRTVIGNFSYAKLPMVRDLERAEDAIVQHSLLSAIAGDSDARTEVIERHRLAEELGTPAVPPPKDEFLILDADSSQSFTIAASVAGADLVVIGPPGTGKSQTISNLIATMIARGKSILFVAEKRAAIEAVVHRLEERRLGDLVLDLHDGAANRRRVAGELQKATVAAGNALTPDLGGLHHQLEYRRD